MNKIKAIIIGGSAGGIKALESLLPALDKLGDFSLIVALHRHPSSDSAIIDILQKLTVFKVKEIEDKEIISPGFIYIAPAGYHVLIDDKKTFSLSVDNEHSYNHPSINAAFETAAKVYQNELIGIILTGANDDGARGIKKIKEYNGFTISQNPQDAEVALMPQASINTGSIDEILSLKEIYYFLKEVLDGN
jgi:two-component system chemotaxis response regulator CheB